MEKNKIIAQTEAKFISGVPTVQRFWDDLHIKKIDILKCLNTPQEGVKTCATVGLSDVDIGLISNKKSLRVELLGASDILIHNFENIVASVAFEIMESKKCFPGCIVRNVIKGYLGECDMKHVLLTSPFLWEEAKAMTISNLYVAWLMIVPISQQELEFACKNGTDALESLFENSNIDIYNLYRKSVI